MNQIRLLMRHERRGFILLPRLLKHGRMNQIRLLMRHERRGNILLLLKHGRLIRWMKHR